MSNACTTGVRRPRLRQAAFAALFLNPVTKATAVPTRANGTQGARDVQRAA